MEILVRICWFALALVHVAPAAVVFSPGLVERLYGASPDGETGVLLVHRGALFLTVVAAAVFAAFDPPSRRLASLVAAISMIGFLIIYARAGTPIGPLRTIAMTDAVALIPLAFVGWRAWLTH
ncbi:MAG: hypothetical protein AAFX08_11810 [Pseudomonadota bacterium]